MKKAFWSLGCVCAVGLVMAEPRPLWELPAEKRGMELLRAR